MTGDGRDPAQPTGSCAPSLDNVEREARFQVLDSIGAVFADEEPDESERRAALAVAEAREQARRERRWNDDRG